MFYKAKNKKVIFEDGIIDYITFGKGMKKIIFIPGVGDGLKTVKGMAVPFAFMYKKFANDFEVYVFSRRRKLPENFTTLEMASDVAKCMEILNIENADVVGVSQGGMIAQHLAINYPSKINKLVLAITSSRPNDLLIDSVDTWVNQLENDDFKGMMIDNCKRSYVGKYLDKMLKLYKTFGFLAKPKCYCRFITQALSCKNHNAYEKLKDITNPTLVIGAGLDGILGVEASKEIHQEIPNSKIYIFEEYSHGVYEQTKEFNEVIFKFLTE